MNTQKKPVILIILDGWGIAPPSKGNAITLADTPVMDKLYKDYPNTLLNATGKAVGLENNETSGSEAGHMNIGAGRIVLQDSTYISESINQGKFFHNVKFRLAVNHAKINNSKLHIMGLMSNNDSPHSKSDHMLALLILAKKTGVKEVYLHLFTDGRDTPPRSALKYLELAEKNIASIGIGKIATVSGRYWAMDRAKHWDRLLHAYDALANGRGLCAESAESAIKNAYNKGLTDEFIEPTIITKRTVDINNRKNIIEEPLARIEDNDSVIFFNLRSDRARQFTKFFTFDDIDHFDGRGRKLKNLFFVAMTDFGPDLNVQTAFPGHDIEKALPWTLRGIRQLYIAESEKYAHMTYFFNGGFANPVGGEDRIMVESPNVSSYDQKPEMSAREITKVIAESLQNNIYDFIAVNFANADMLGHTGNIGAAIRGIEIVDDCVGEIMKIINEKEGVAFVTADHGNADEMIDLKTGEILTMHSKNPVPFIIASNYKEVFKKNKLRTGGILGDIAPTILDIMEIEKPAEMAQNTLIEERKEL